MPPAFVKLPRLSDAERAYQQQLQNERELQKLRKEYHILEGERTQTQFTGFRKLNKRSHVVTIFKKEYDEVLTDLRVADSEGNKHQEAVQFNNLTSLLQEYESFNRRVQVEKTYINEVEGQISMVGKEVQSLAGRQITDKQLEERYHYAAQTLETLENKLETQMTKFNWIVAKNGKLREEVDHLMWDRKNFMRMWKSLISKLTAGKQIMLDLIEQATLAFDQREEWCTRLNLIRVKAHRDLINNVDLMRQHITHIRMGQKLEDFFSVKGQKRAIYDLIEKNAQKRREKEEECKNKLSAYSDMMTEIQEFTKQTILAEIVRQYCQEEGYNFSKFRNIIDNIREMEVANDELGLKQIEVEEKKALQESRHEGQDAKILSLEAQFDKIKELSDESEHRYQTLDAGFKEMMNGISELFHLCKCNQDPLLQLLGDNTKIEHYNVLLYLQLLEQKIQEYLIRVVYKDNKDSKNQKKTFRDDQLQNRIFEIDDIVKAHPCIICMEHELVSDVIEIVQVPYTKEKAAVHLAHRMKTPGAETVVHTVSNCHLPKARKIMQQRYT